jgi:hypothetical protein
VPPPQESMQVEPVQLALTLPAPQESIEAERMQVVPTVPTRQESVQVGTVQVGTVQVENPPQQERIEQAAMDLVPYEPRLAGSKRAIESGLVNEAALALVVVNDDVQPPSNKKKKSCPSLEQESALSFDARTVHDSIIMDAPKFVLEDTDAVPSEEISIEQLDFHDAAQSGPDSPLLNQYFPWGYTPEEDDKSL